jgi:hypothetical protein
MFDRSKIPGKDHGDYGYSEDSWLFRDVTRK